MGDVFGIRDATEVLYKNYKVIGKFKKSLEMHELYLVMRDSINNQNNTKEILNQQIQ